MIYHLRYYWLVLCRWCRMPFDKYARTCISLDELIADWEREPEMRQLLKDARTEMEPVLKKLRADFHNAQHY